MANNSLPPGAPKWLRDPISVSSVLIAAATIVNLFVSIGLWQATSNSVDITRRIFEAANRPYVGAEAVKSKRDFVAKVLDFGVVIKNFGTIPAKGFEAEWNVLLNDKRIPSSGEVPHNPSTLFPTQEVHFEYTIRREQFDRVMGLADTLILRVSLKYEADKDKTDAYCEKYQYNPERDLWLNLGTCQ